MNLDIETRHTLMRPEWHRIIDDWVTRETTAHADLAAVDLTLQHDELAGDRVDAVARVGRRTVRAAAANGQMAAALRDALAALEREVDAGGAVAAGRRAVAPR
jgi:ribosome-associated translation inhibitor RaiA